MDDSVIKLDTSFLTHLIYNITDIVDFVNTQKETQFSFTDYTQLEVSLSDMIFVSNFDICGVNLSVSYRGSKKYAKKIDDKSLEKIFNITGKLVK